MTAANSTWRTFAGLLATTALLSPAAGEDLWDVTTIDDTGSTGEGASLALRPSGQPAVSFFRFADFSLQYAVLDGATWQTETVDTDLGLAGGHTSLAFLADGHPAISYYDGVLRDLLYAEHDGATWNLAPVDTFGRVGLYNSLVILPTDQPAISYYDELFGDLKYATFNGSTWDVTTIDTVDDVGLYTSIALQPSGEPAISYYDSTNRRLKYAWFDGTMWNIEVVDELGHSAGTHTSLAFLPSGDPAISYQAQPLAPPDTDTDLRYAFFNGTWSRMMVDAQPDVSVGEFTTLVIRDGGEPAIAYYDATHGDLKFARKLAVGWALEIIDAGGSVGQHSSAVILPTGKPAAAYRDADNTDLVYATPPDLAPAPVSLSGPFTSTAWTDLGGENIVENGPAYNQGFGTVGIQFAFAAASTAFNETGEGHMRGVIGVRGDDGFDIGTSPSCENAGGSVSATIDVGVSAAHPQGSPLQADVAVIARGDPGDDEDYLLQLLRGPTVVAEISPAAPAGQVVTVFAGESLTLELSAFETDELDDGEGYDAFFEYRLVLLGGGSVPGDINGDGVVDVLDLLEVLGAWGPCPGCPADLNGDGVVNVLDLLEVLANWT